MEVSGIDICQVRLVLDALPLFASLIHYEIEIKARHVMIGQLLVLWFRFRFRNVVREGITRIVVQAGSDMSRYRRKIFSLAQFCSVFAKITLRGHGDLEVLLCFGFMNK